MDDAFVVFSNDDDCDVFLDSLSLLYPSLCFTFEKESNMAFPFWDVLIENLLPSSSPPSIENPHLLVNIFAGIPSVHRNAIT